MNRLCLITFSSRLIYGRRCIFLGKRACVWNHRKQVRGPQDWKRELGIKSERGTVIIYD
jgi:hypothetical protein